MNKMSKGAWIIVCNQQGCIVKLEQKWAISTKWKIFKCQSLYLCKYTLLPSTSGFNMMIKREEGGNGKQRREDTHVGGLSKDLGTIGVCVETGGFFILPNITSVFTHKLEPQFKLPSEQRSRFGRLF